MLKEERRLPGAMVDGGDGLGVVLRAYSWQILGGIHRHFTSCEICWHLLGSKITTKQNLRAAHERPEPQGVRSTLALSLAHYCYQSSIFPDRSSICCCSQLAFLYMIDLYLYAMQNQH